jgi:hypothetical protein
MFDTILLLAGAAEQSILPLALRGHNPHLAVVPVGSAAELAAGVNQRLILFCQ